MRPRCLLALLPLLGCAEYDTARPTCAPWEKLSPAGVCSAIVWPDRGIEDCWAQDYQESNAVKPSPGEPPLVDAVGREYRLCVTICDGEPEICDEIGLECLDIDGTQVCGLMDISETWEP